MIRSFWRGALGVLAAMALAACASAQSAPTPSTAELQMKVLIAQSAYEIPLRVAVAYNKRPRCTVPATVIVCSDADVVAELRKANDAIMSGFTAAMAIASTPGASESAVTLAIAVATNAIGPLQAILDAYKIGGK